MPDFCSVYGCKNTTSKGVKLHSFPFQDENRLPKWISFVNRGSKWIPKRSSKICSAHFQNIIYGERGNVITDPVIPPIKLLSPPPKRVMKSLSYGNIVVSVDTSSPNIHVRPHGLSFGIPKENTKEIHKVEVRQGTKRKTTQENQPNLVDYNDVKNSRSTQTEINYEKIIEKQDMIIKRLQKNTVKQNTTILHLRKKLSISKRNNALKSLHKVPILKQKNTSGLEILIGRKKKRKYTDDTRKFAMALNFYSAKAYRFVRNSFSKSLPHPRQLHRWTEHLNVEPGFLTQCLESLKTKSATSKCKLFCCLQLDEMSIRQQLISKGNGFEGFVDYGDFQTSKAKTEMAKNALFIMAVGVNGYWKIPIAYFLTAGITADFLSNVISRSIDLLNSANIHCMCVTYDGLSSNLRAAKLLGASMGGSKIQSWFISNTKQKVFIIPDVCHMLKLLRNLWKKAGVFCIDNHKLSWRFIEMLQDEQQKEGLRMGNKINIRHVNFEQQKMKVFLAAQIFSSSVANALRVCKKLGIKGFEDEDCEYTADFIETIDRLFDCLNSKNVLSKSYAAPISKKTEHLWKAIFTKAKYLFSNLKLTDGQLIMNTRKKTPLVGFLAAIQSTEGMYQKYVSTSALKYILTYKFSQDHTETFFTIVRSSQGYNNNPNVVQLKSSLKKILATKIDYFSSGNCIPQDTTEMTLTKTMKPNFSSFEEPCILTKEPQLGECLNVILQNLSIFSDCVVTYIAGWVTRKIRSIVKCTKCCSALESVVKTVDLMKPKYQLIRLKQNGGLVIPSEDVVKVCNITERIYREYSICKNFNRAVIITRVITYLLENKPIFNCLDSHVLDLSATDNHIYQLIKLISNTYCALRMHHSAKLHTLNNKPTSSRIWNNKMTLINGV